MMKQAYNATQNTEFEQEVDRRIELAPATVRRGGREPVHTATASAKSRTVLIGMLVALAVGGSTVLGTSAFHYPVHPHIGISTTTGLGTPFGGQTFLAADSMVTDQQWQERETAFQQFAARGPVQLDRLPATQSLDYIAKAVSDPALRSGLTKNVQEQNVEMVAIGYFDDVAEDGDIVRVQAAGVDVILPLFHKVQYLGIELNR